jgi:hypothetical protein
MVEERITIDSLTPLDAPAGLSRDQKQIWDTFERAKLTAIRKNFDYGSSVWEPPIMAPEMSSQSSIEVRMSDKIRRIVQLKGAGAAVKDETVEDTFMDLGVYCFLWVIAHKRQSGGNTDASSAVEGPANAGGSRETDEGDQAPRSAGARG